LNIASDIARSVSPLLADGVGFHRLPPLAPTAHNRLNARSCLTIRAAIACNPRCYCLQSALLLLAIRAAIACNPRCYRLQSALLLLAIRAAIACNPRCYCLQSALLLLAIRAAIACNPRCYWLQSARLLLAIRASIACKAEVYCERKRLQTAWKSFKRCATHINTMTTTHRALLRSEG
jgi:hypothetical protein